MTTKDQTIVQNLRETVSTVLEGWTLPDAVRKQLETAYWAEQPPSPDCRTCQQYQEDEGICLYPLNHGLTQCTNGDQYQPAPKVVLWRTE